jgi:hypothetical protein
MFLSDDFGEFLWTVFARQNLIAHEEKSRLYVNAPLGKWRQASSFGDFPLSESPTNLPCQTLA